MRTSGFGAAHPQHLLLPVQIAELKAADLTGAQAIGDPDYAQSSCSGKPQPFREGLASNPACGTVFQPVSAVS